MSRPKRTWHPDYFYHITSRGTRRESLFNSEQDFLIFFNILSSLRKNFYFEIASYCLMSNHFHLLLRSHELPISQLMQRLKWRYAVYFNERNNSNGHVFDKRFFSKQVVDPVGMFEVSTYVHLNPVRAGIVSLPQEYHWSSFNYLHHSSSYQQPFMNLQPIYAHLEGNTNKEKISTYQTLCQQKWEDDKKAEQLAKVTE